MAFDVYHYVTPTRGLLPGDVIHLAYAPPRTAAKYRPAGKHYALAPNEALLKTPTPITAAFTATIDVTWGAQKVGPAQKVELQFEVVDGPTGSDGYELAHANGDNFTLAPGSVGTPILADLSVTTAKLADLSVTTPKLADAAVTTPKIADANVTGPKLAPGAAVANIGYTPLNPAAVVTPPQFDNTTALPTTAFVTRFGKQYSRYVVISSATVLTAAHAGALVQIGSPNPFAVTLPSAAAMPDGATITFWGASSGGVQTITAAGADRIYTGASGASVASFPLTERDTAELMAIGGNAWIVIDGSIHDWPLAPQFDNTPKLATTAWANRRGLQSSGRYYPTVNTVLTAQHAGAHIQLQANNLTITLPLASALPAGTQIWFFGAGTGGAVEAQGGGDVIYPGAGGSVPWLAVGLGDTLVLSSLGAGGWAADGGSAQLRYSTQFNGGTNHQVFPSGNKLQCGLVNVASANLWTTFNYPSPFTSSVTGLVGSVAAGGAGASGGALSFSPISVSQFQVWAPVANTNAYWMAFGQ